MLIPKTLSEKILVAGPDFKNHRGGIGEVIQVYANEFEQFNFLPTYKYHSNNVTKSIYFTKQVFTFIYRLIKNRRIKIIHVHFSDRGSFFRKSIIVLLSKGACKKVVYHCHAAELHLFYRNSGLIKYYIRFILRISDRVACVSPQWKTFFSSIVSPENVEVINNPVAVPFFNQMPARKETIHFLFLGRIGERKGLFDLLKAINLLPDCKKKCMRLLVGGDGDVQRLKETINDLELQEIVFYKGWVTGKDKHDLLSTSDVYVLPSYNEGLPISILEAMAYEMPVISTPVGGISEVVRNGENGFINEPGDVLSLSKSLNRFISDKGLSKILGKKSMDLVKPYLASGVMNELSKVYTELLTNRNSRRQL